MKSSQFPYEGLSRKRYMVHVVEDVKTPQGIMAIREYKIVYGKLDDARRFGNVELEQEWKYRTIRRMK